MFPPEVLERGRYMPEEMLLPNFFDWFSSRIGVSVEEAKNMVILPEEISQRFHEDFPSFSSEPNDPDATLEDVTKAKESILDAENWHRRWGHPKTPENLQLWSDALRADGWLQTSNGRPLTPKDYLERELEAKAHFKQREQEVERQQDRVPEGSGSSMMAGWSIVRKGEKNELGDDRVVDPDFLRRVDAYEAVRLQGAIPSASNEEEPDYFSPAATPTDALPRSPGGKTSGK